MEMYLPSTHLVLLPNKLEVSIGHIPHVNVYGIECYNYSSSADSATPRD